MMTSTKRVIPGIALLCAAIVHPVSSALADDPSTRPIAEGNFTTSSDPGWIFFQPQGFGDSGCGIGPDGTVGCDIVPGRLADGTPVQEGQPGPPGSYSCDGRRCPLPPPGVNQTVVTAQVPAEYIQSGSATFTRDVGVLPTGYRLVNGGAWCALSDQATLRCVSGSNGFTLNSSYGLLD